MYGRIGGDWDPKKLVRALRLRFSNAATLGDYDEHPEDLAKETDCIGEVILALGGRETSGDSLMRARLAALEMELEALKRGLDAGSGGLACADLAAAVKQQIEVLKDTLSSQGNQSSVTAVKADLVWPTLTDDRSDTRHVSQFYEEFEDVCALANNCKGITTVRACP